MSSVTPSGNAACKATALCKDAAKLLLISKPILLECWPEEDLKPQRKKLCSAESKILANSIIVLASSQKMAQIKHVRLNPKGKHVLQLHGHLEVAVEDVMEDPWSFAGSEAAFSSALEEALCSQSITATSSAQVAEAVHRVEQARYCYSLRKQAHKPDLTPRGQATLEEQLEACQKRLLQPPDADTLAMARAACRDEEPGEVPDGGKALQAHLAAIAAHKPGRHEANGCPRASRSPSPPMTNGTAAEPMAADSTAAERLGAVNSIAAERPGAIKDTPAERPGAVNSIAAEQPGAINTTPAERPGVVNNTAAEPMAANSAERLNFANSLHQAEPITRTTAWRHNGMDPAEPMALDTAEHGSCSSPAAALASTDQSIVQTDANPCAAAWFGSNSPEEESPAMPESSDLAGLRSHFATGASGSSSSLAAFSAAVTGTKQAEPSELGNTGQAEAEPSARAASGRGRLQEFVEASGTAFKWNTHCENLLGWAAMLQDCITAAEITLKSRINRKSAASVYAPRVTQLQKQFDRQLKRLAGLATAMATATDGATGHGAKRSADRHAHTDSRAGVDPVQATGQQPAAPIRGADPVQATGQQPANPTPGAPNASAEFVKAFDRAQGLANQVANSILQLVEALIKAGDKNFAPSLSQRFQDMQASPPLAVADAVQSTSAAATSDGPDAAPKGRADSMLHGQRGSSEDLHAKRKRKRIEWDAQVAAASSAAVLKAAASASAAQLHLNSAAAQQQQASVSRPCTPSSELPSTARQKRQAIEWAPDGATPAEAAPQLQPSQLPAAALATAVAAAPPQLASAPSPALAISKPVKAASQQPGAPCAAGRSSSSIGTEDTPARLHQAELPATQAHGGAVEGLPKPNAKAPPLWQGTIQWSWGDDYIVKGTFQGSLVNAGSFPLGCRCPARGDVILNLDKAELQIQRVLGFSSGRAQLLRDHFMGCLWLLDTAGSPGQNSHVSVTSGAQPPTGAPSTAASAAWSAVQYCRVLGCLEGSGQAQLAQCGHLSQDDKFGAKQQSHAIDILFVAAAAAEAWMPGVALDQTQIEAAASLCQRTPSVVYAVPLLLDQAASRCLWGETASTVGAAPSADVNKPLSINQTPNADVAPSAAALPGAHDQAAAGGSHEIHVIAYQLPPPGTASRRHDAMLADLPSAGLTASMAAESLSSQTQPASCAAAVPVTAPLPKGEEDQQDSQLLPAGLVSQMPNGLAPHRWAVQKRSSADQQPASLTEGLALGKQPAHPADPGAVLNKTAYTVSSALAKASTQVTGRAGEGVAQAAAMSVAAKQPAQDLDRPSIAAIGSKAKGPATHPVAESSSAQQGTANTGNAEADQAPAAGIARAAATQAQRAARARAQRAASKPASPDAAPKEDQQQKQRSPASEGQQQQQQQASKQEQPTAKQELQKGKKQQVSAEQLSASGKRQQQQADPAAQPAMKKSKHSPILAPPALTSKAAGKEPSQAEQPSKASRVPAKVARSSTGDRIADEDRGLPQCTLDSIYNGLKDMGLLRNRSGKAQLTRRDITELGETLPPLAQLRALSQYGNRFQPQGNPVIFLSSLSAREARGATHSAASKTAWLVPPSSSSPPAAEQHLSPDAEKMLMRLGRYDLLRPDAVPEVAAQVLPQELQSAYLLALAGYDGSHLAKFATDLLQRVLWQVCWVVHQHSKQAWQLDTVNELYHKASGHHFRAPVAAAAKAMGKSAPDQAASSALVAVPDQAGSRPSSGVSEARQEKAGPAAKAKHKPIPVPESASRSTLPDQNPRLKAAAPLPNASSSGNQISLVAQPIKEEKAYGGDSNLGASELRPRVQLSISDVRRKVLFGLNSLGRLRSTSLDPESQDFLQKQGPLWQMRVLSTFASSNRRPGNSSALLTIICKNNQKQMLHQEYAWVHERRPHIEETAHSLLLEAVAAGIFPAEPDSLQALQSLPPNLHAVVVCYAIGSVAVHKSQVAARDLHKYQTPLEEVHLALHTVVQYAHQLIEDVVPQGNSSAAPSGPSSRPPSAPSDPRLHPTAPPQNPVTSSHAQNSSGTSFLPVSHHHQPQLQLQLQNSSTQLPGFSQGPKPCRFFYRKRGCERRDCPFLHNISHAEYVSYMRGIGLLPHGLNFQAERGRERCVEDEAVDVLNELMTHGRIPRGSLADSDLRPLAFLEDPMHGEPSKLQLQVAQQFAQLQSIHEPAKQLAEVAQDVHRQRQGGSRHPTPPQDSGPFHHQQPYDPFGPLPHASLPNPGPPHHSPPFAPTDALQPAGFIPGDDSDPEDTLPFPCFRYEEELAAALLLHGRVGNVDHLLHVAPECRMPPEVVDCFPGRFPGDIEAFLRSRPWLFMLDGRGISLTPDARLGVVYKREVLQALWQALHENVELNIADVAEMCPFPHLAGVVEAHDGLANFLSTPLFSDDIQVRYVGPGDVGVALQPHLAAMMDPAFRRYS